MLDDALREKKGKKNLKKFKNQKRKKKFEWIKSKYRVITWARISTLILLTSCHGLVSRHASVLEYRVDIGNVRMHACTCTAGDQKQSLVMSVKVDNL